MLSSPPKFLIIVLVLLQLIAPLVHAHTSGETSSQDIHLHGFEHFNMSSEDAIHVAITAQSISECSIISVGTGIKHNKSSNNTTSPCFITEQYFSFNYFRVHRLISINSLQQAHIYSSPYLLEPSRAPPFLNIIS